MQNAYLRKYPRIIKIFPIILLFIGFTTNNNFHTYDDDYDGIINLIDNCPKTSYPNVNSKGCIEIDSLKIPRNKPNLNQRVVNFNQVLSKKPKVFLIYGQSNASCSCECCDYDDIDFSSIYYFFQGELYNSVEPMPGSTGNFCSPWKELGNLITKFTNRPIIFANASVGGQPLEKLIEGENLEFLLETIVTLNKSIGYIDGVLIHQGEANHKLVLGNSNYLKDFEKLNSILDDVIPSPKIFLSRATYCNNFSDLSLISLQDSIINQFENVYAGPNTDRYINERFDNCHFSCSDKLLFSQEFFDLITRPKNLLKKL